MHPDSLFSRLAAFEKDSQLNACHFALLSAILFLGHRQGQDTVINVSRSKLMSLSHIKTLPTYHKYFSELQSMGYIRYTPSYHPGYKSQVELLTGLHNH